MQPSCIRMENGLVAATDVSTDGAVTFTYTAPSSSAPTTTVTLSVPGTSLTATVLINQG